MRECWIQVGTTCISYDDLDMLDKGDDHPYAWWLTVGDDEDWTIHDFPFDTVKDAVCSSIDFAESHNYRITEIKIKY